MHPVPSHLVLLAAMLATSPMLSADTVWLDDLDLGKTLWESGVLRSGEAAKPAEVTRCG